MVAATLSGIFCPHCAHPVRVNAATGVDRLHLALQLQAERFGAGVVCEACRQGFIYTRQTATETLSIEDRLTQLHNHGRERTLMLPQVAMSSPRLENIATSNGDAA